MKKHLLTFVLSVLVCFAHASAQNTTYSWVCSSSNSVKTASPTTMTFGDITWDQTWTSTGSNNGSRDGNAPQSLRYGSKKNPLNNLTFSSDFFAGKTIVSISINAKMPSKAATTFVANIDGTPVGDAISLPTSFGDCTFDNLNKTVSEKGTLELVFVNSNTTADVSSNGGVYLHSITIVYTEGPVGPATLGEVTGKYGTTSVANDGECAVDPGTEFEFAAANAESITVAYEGSDNVEHTNDYTGATATWTAPTPPGDYIVTVTATLGDATKTLTFILSVNAPVLGELSAKAGTVDLLDTQSYTLHGGTQVVFTAANAESIKVEYLGSAADAQTQTQTYTGATATWTVPEVADKYLVSAVATLGEATTDIMFELTVNEASSIDKPMTVAEALAACTADGPTGVYVKGIVTGVTTTYDSSYKNVSFNIADAANDTDVLLAFRSKWGEGVTAPADNNPAVGATVVISGDLTIYNGTKEFAAGNLIVKYEAPAGGETPDPTPDPVGTSVSYDFTDITALTPAFDPDGAIADGTTENTMYHTKGVTFVSGPVTLVAQGTGNNRLYNSTSSSYSGWALRIYKNTTVTISATAGTTLKSIVFEPATSSYATNLGKATFSTGSYSSTNKTITFDAGTTEVAITPGATIGIKTITVYYEGEAQKAAEATVPTLAYNSEHNSVSVVAPYGYYIDYMYTILDGSTTEALGANVFTRVEANACNISGLPALADLADGDAIRVIARAIDPADETNVAEDYITIAADGTTTGVNDIVSDSSNAPAVYYNLQGVRVANPESGLYIRVQGKTATKVLVR